MWFKRRKQTATNPVDEYMSQLKASNADREVMIQLAKRYLDSGGDPRRIRATLNRHMEERVSTIPDHKVAAVTASLEKLIAKRR